MRFLTRFSPRYGAAMLAGLLLALSFPKAGVAGLAWLAPGLMLFAAFGQPAKERFRIGYLAGLVNYLVTLYWLLFIPFPAGAIVGWLGLSAYLALYPAVWVWLCWKCLPGGQDVPDQDWRALVAQFFTTAWWQRASWAILCGALWVALEMVVARFLSGFPWCLLGISQYRMVPLIQLASVAGVYGISFLLVWFSVSLVIAFLRIIRQPGLRWSWLLELRLALIVLMGVTIFGLGRLLERTDTERELKVALIQPSIAQPLIWDHSQDASRFNRIMELSRLALAAKPDLLIWPESSMPNFTEENFSAISNLVVRHQVWMILGSDDAERRPDATGPDDYLYFNAAFLFSPKGQLMSAYRKRHLVMFGEYLPFARRFPFLRRLIPIPGDFTPGDRSVAFELAEPRARLTPLICFEDVIPGLTRQSVAGDIDAILNLTNDGWFGESAAQWQQAANAVFRAVENGLPLIRCTNNGLTCWIDSRGWLRDVFRSDSGGAYGPGFLIARIPLPPAGRERESTFYWRHGDAFGWGCVGLSLAVCAGRMIQRRRK